MYDSRYSNNVQLFFLNLKQQHGGWMNSVFSFRFYIDDEWTIGAEQVELGLETKHNHTHKFYMKYCLVYKSANVNIATVRNFEVISGEFNVDRTCI
jgi:hypothetical protein